MTQVRPITPLILKYSSGGPQSPTYIDECTLPPPQNLGEAYLDYLCAISPLLLARICCLMQLSHAVYLHITVNTPRGGEKSPASAPMPTYIRPHCPRTSSDRRRDRSFTWLQNFVEKDGKSDFQLHRSYGCGLEAFYTQYVTQERHRSKTLG